MKIYKPLLNKLLYLSALGISIFAFIFVISVSWIGYDVKSQCQEAEEKYTSNDCVDSLINLLNDDSNSFRDRNNAIWALGQLGDKRALPILESYYTGNITKKESLDKGLSQYELKKAIKLAQGGINITAIFWRNAVFD